MPRRPRSYLEEDAFFHVTARGAGGGHIYEEDVDRLDFTDLFWAAALEFEWDCFVLCLMGTHYHAVLKARREQLSAGMHKVNGSYARRFNVRRSRRGHLFEARFSSWVVDDETHLEATIAYGVWNPSEPICAPIPKNGTGPGSSRAAPRARTRLSRAPPPVTVPWDKSLRLARESQCRRRLRLPE
jgi:hypothetical protein